MDNKTFVRPTKTILFALQYPDSKPHTHKGACICAILTSLKKPFALNCKKLTPFFRKHQCFHIYSLRHCICELVLSAQTAQDFLTFYVTLSLRIVCSGCVPESRTQATNPEPGACIVCVSEVL